MICGAALLGLSSQAAAQTASEEVAEVVVTGTRIPSPNLESVSPVTAVSAAEIKATGVTRVEDMINSLPQAFAAQGAALSTGTATVSLRGLGATRTQVLIDGRRLMPGTPNTAGGSLAADINFIPSALIQRVDVLTGGASAVYGADAVGGVVNFIMMRNFEGVRVDAQYGLYQHENNNSVAGVVSAAASAAASPEFFALPKDNVRDGEMSQVTLVIGVNSPDGKGNVTAYAGYRHVEPILQGNRDYSACTLNSGADFLSAGCGGSGTAFPARVGSQVVDVTGPGNTFRSYVGSRDVYNFGPSNYYQRPDDRYVLGAFAEYEIAEWAKAYMDVMFMDDSSTFQIAPGGIFAGTFPINCANPFLSAQQRGLMPATADSGGGTCATNPAGTFRGLVSRRNIEGGGRQGRMQHQQYRYVVGLRGDLNDNWAYDFAMQYGRVSFSQVSTGFFRLSGINNALNVVQGPNGPVCASVLNGSDAACVPYNIFQLGGVTREALDYLETPSTIAGNLFERVVNFNIGGDLTDYGVKSPWANDGVGISIGAEYRRETMDFAADFVSASGQLTGAGGAAPPVNGAFDVYEVFSEARIPLVQDAPFAKNLTMELAFRYSDYSSIGTTETYKIAGDWELIDGLRLRGGYNRAVRAPHVLELFSQQNVVLDGTQDPCAGLAAGDPQVGRCMQAFNLTAAQVLAIEANPANQYNGQIGGNPNLDPETADTWTVGFVYQPSWLDGLQLSTDWYEIDISGAVGSLGTQRIVTECAAGNQALCGNIERFGPVTPTGVNEITRVFNYFLNVASSRVEGIDTELTYRMEPDVFGNEFESLTFRGLAGYVIERSNISTPGAAAIESSGSTGTPEFTALLTSTYSLGPWSLMLQGRFIDSTTLSDGTGLWVAGVQADDVTVASNTWFNGQVSYNGETANGATWNVALNVQNLFDRNPPIQASYGSRGGAQTISDNYDVEGRRYQLSVNYNF